MKDFIPFELAYELKEIGFDEECLGFYDAYNGDSHLFLHDRYKPLWLVRTWRRLFNKSSEETTFVSQSYVEYIYGVCLAPTFSQAFRFLREKYKASPIITCYSELGNAWRYHIPNEGGEYDFYTYEEAELECLRKLIQIVKQKQ
jgi:hypothetical protein